MKDEPTLPLLNVDEIENPIVGDQQMDVLVISERDLPWYHWRGGDDTSLCTARVRGDMMKWSDAVATDKQLCGLCSDNVERMKEGWQQT